MKNLILNRLGVFLFIFISVTALLPAQNIAVTGTVIDEKTSRPIPQVTVVVDGTIDSVFTNENGLFSFSHPIPPGEQILIFKKVGYITKRFPVTIEEGKTKDVGKVFLLPDRSESPLETAVVILSETELNSDNGRFDNISGLLYATKDVFLNAAAFDFSPTFFRPKGFNSDMGRVLINGIEMNKIYDGRPQWSNWGGLNDVQRNRAFTMGFGPSAVSFGGLAGTTNIIMRASEYSAGGKFSYARANRSYSGRLMGSYHTGLLPSGWAFSVSASRRYGEEGFREGSIYDASAFFLSVEKVINESHSLNFTGIFTPVRRGKTSANTQEVYDLKGIKYNSYWGYQNGEIRNSRIKEIVEPFFMLNHLWKLSEKISLNNNIFYQFGRIGNSRLEYGGSSLLVGPEGNQVYVGGGANPDPAYYQKLPGYFLRFPDDPDYESAYFAEKEFVNDGRIDWASLYAANRTVAATGGNAVYVLYEDRNDDRQFIANSILKMDVNENIILNGKLSFRNLISENYAVITDLLGGNAFLDVDSFSEGVEAQSNLLTPNHLVGVGEKFKYSFQYSARAYEGFLQAQFKYRKYDFYAGINLSQTAYQRTGFFKNGNFPENSLGESELLNFLDFGVKSGITYKLSGRHIFKLKGGFFTKPPTLRNSFSNSRQNNEVVIGIESEKVFNTDLSYFFRSPYIEGRLTGYFAQFKDATEISFFYADGLSGLGRNTTTAFVQEVLYDIDKRHLGIEFGLAAELTSEIKLKAAAGVGEYYYSDNPNLYLTSDDFDAPVHYGASYLKNYRVAGGPQQAYQLAFEYRSPQYWFFTLSGNYFSHAFLDIAPLTRTRNFATDADGQPILNYDESIAAELLKQEQFDDYFLVNLIGGKSWRIEDYFFGFFFSVNNLFNTIHKTGGYEQSRNVNYTTLKEDRERENPIFAPKYWYGYGTNYYAHVYLRF